MSMYVHALYSAPHFQTQFLYSGRPPCSPVSAASQMVALHMTALPCKNGSDAWNKIEMWGQGWSVGWIEICVILQWSTYIYNYHQLSTYRMAQHCTTSVLESLEVLDDLTHVIRKCRTGTRLLCSIMWWKKCCQLIRRWAQTKEKRWEEFGWQRTSWCCLAATDSALLVIATRGLWFWESDLKDPQFSATFETPRCFESVR